MNSNDRRNKFELLYEKYKNLMYYVAYAVMQDSSSAEEVVHDSFVKVLQNLHRIEDIDSTATKNFVATITKRLALNRKYKDIKHRDILNKHKDIELRPELYYESAAEHLEQKEAYQELVEAILKLPGKYSDVLFLKYDNKLSDKEIAESLNLSVSNVRKTAQRAKAALAKELN